MARYIAQSADRYGVFAERHCVDFPHALETAREFYNRWPDRMAFVVNIDEVDLGRGDGLTDEERDAVDAAIDELRRNRRAGYVSRFVAEHSPATVAASAELAASLGDQDGE